MWWAIQLLLHCIFIAKFGFEEIFKISEHLVMDRNYVALATALVSRLVVSSASTNNKLLYTSFYSLTITANRVTFCCDIFLLPQLRLLDF